MSSSRRISSREGAAEEEEERDRERDTERDALVVRGQQPRLDAVTGVEVMLAFQRDASVIIVSHAWPASEMPAGAAGVAPIGTWPRPLPSDLMYANNCKKLLFS